jgi:hypothetical protein
MIDAVRDQVVDLARQHVPPREIFARLQPRIDRIYTVYEILAAARKTDNTIPRFNTAGLPRRVTPVFLSNDDLAALEGPARIRKITPSELARQLLTTILRDDLVDSVLDDDQGGEP